MLMLVLTFVLWGVVFITAFIGVKVMVLGEIEAPGNQLVRGVEARKLGALLFLLSLASFIIPFFLSILVSAYSGKSTSMLFLNVIMILATLKWVNRRVAMLSLKNKSLNSVM